LEINQVFAGRLLQHIFLHLYSISRNVHVIDIHLHSISHSVRVIDITFIASLPMFFRVVFCKA